MQMQNISNRICQEELENRIIQGLSCEWKLALSVLDPDKKRKMRMPLFRLSGMKKCLGSWSRSKKEICLSSDFVINHPWDSVRDVLLHEMAHQLASDVLGEADEPEHGPIFRNACHLLRANAKASGRYQTLHDQIQQDAVSSEDKMMIRIQKLMALAGSQNQNEAEAAMAKARQLIRKYNIQVVQAHADRNYKSIFLGSPMLRHFREDYYLANLIIDYYFVKGIWISAFVLHKAKMGRVLEISGTDKNLKIAEYIYEFINHFIGRKWNEYTVGTSYNRYHKTDFAIGIIEGFRQKLKDQDQRNDSAAVKSWDVVAVEDPNLAKYMDYKYPSVKTVSKKTGHRSHQLVADGMTIGRNLIISKGISESSQESLYLLGK